MTCFSVNAHINHVVLCPATAVLNMDNAVVDHETLQALYENVSMNILRSPFNGCKRNNSFQSSL